MQSRNLRRDEFPALVPLGRDETRLEVGADDDWEERWARWQRFAWAAMAVILLLGITGLFGRGPVDQATAIASKRLFRVGYEPVVRFRTPTVFTLHIWRELADQSSVVSIRGNASLLSALQIRHADPHPEAWRAAADGPTMEFHVSSPATEVTIDPEVEPSGDRSFFGRVYGRQSASRVTASADSTLRGGWVRSYGRRRIVFCSSSFRSLAGARLHR